LHLRWPATQPDLALGQPAINPWPSAEAIDPAGLRAGERIQIDEGVMLEVLDAGGEWVLGVRYGDFTTLLPAGLSRAAQTVLAASTPEQRLTLLKSPDPGTGTWPAPEFIEALAPQFVLWPQDTTYPPGTTGALAGLPGERVESKATAEVVTDGKRMWTRQLSGAGSLPGGR
jgi:hypothetical protein